MSRVYLHVGSPKTGTTYLQHRLTLNGRELAGHGIHFPSGSRFVDADFFQFRAALDLLGQDWGGEEGHAKGAWADFCRRARKLDGTVILSHEILAPAPPEVIERVFADLAGYELHVVLSARDLARQIPAAWQESVKQGRPWSYSKFIRRMRDGRTWMHRAMDVPGVLSAWGKHVPPERMHLVTVPQRRAPDGSEVPRDALWLRFCEAFGIDPAWAPVDSTRANASLGVAEAEVVRRLNKRITRPVRREASSDKLVRDLLAQRAFAERTSARVLLPPSEFAWVEERAEEWLEWIGASGIDVIGDVEELRPVPHPEGVTVIDPRKLRSRDLIDPALAAVEAMTREAARRPDPDLAFGAVMRDRVRRLRGR